MMKPRFLAKRFVAGTTLDEAIEKAKKLNEEGLSVAFDHLGEDVEDKNEALKATKEYEEIIEAIHSNTLDADISIKLSQIGLAIDKKFAKQNLFEILKKAKGFGMTVEIDMEGSKYTTDTIDLYLSALKNYENTVQAIQSYMRRSELDVLNIIKHKGKIRLVKGTYKESKEIVFGKKEEVQDNYLRLLKICLEKCRFTAIGTHNEESIGKAKELIKINKIPKSRYEFELLLGIRNSIQRTLASEGHPVRVYMPYGDQWFPYFSRRMRERKENFYFVVKNIFRK